MSILIPGMKMPKMPEKMEQGQAVPYVDVRVFADGDAVISTGVRPYYKKYQAIELPPHGRLIDADALIADLKRQCREVFRVDAVSPDDFWITRIEAYNERLWGTWCESFFDYLQTRPTIIPADPDGGADG